MFRTNPLLPLIDPLRAFLVAHRLIFRHARSLSCFVSASAARRTHLAHYGIQSSAGECQHEHNGHAHAICGAGRRGSRTSPMPIIHLVSTDGKC